MAKILSHIKLRRAIKRTIYNRLKNIPYRVTYDRRISDFYHNPLGVFTWILSRLE